MANNELITTARNRAGLMAELNMMFDMIDRVKDDIVELEINGNNTYNQYSPYENRNAPTIRLHSTKYIKAVAEGITILAGSTQITVAAILSMAAVAYSLSTGNISRSQDNEENIANFSMISAFPNWRTVNPVRFSKNENTSVKPVKYVGNLIGFDEPPHGQLESHRYRTLLGNAVDFSNYQLMFVVTKEQIEVFKAPTKSDDVVRALTPSEGSTSSDLGLSPEQRSMLAEMNRHNLGLDRRIRNPLEVPGNLRVSYTNNSANLVY